MACSKIGYTGPSCSREGSCSCSGGCGCGSGCSSCDGGCRGTCNTSCSGGCKATCADDCSSTCTSACKQFKRYNGSSWVGVNRLVLKPSYIWLKRYSSLKSDSYSPGNLSTISVYNCLIKHCGMTKEQVDAIFPEDSTVVLLYDSRIPAAAQKELEKRIITSSVVGRRTKRYNGTSWVGLGYKE